MDWRGSYIFVLGLICLVVACAPAAQEEPSVAAVREIPAPAPFKDDGQVVTAIELYETWPGTCETYEDALSEPVQEGVRLFQEAALQCVLRQALAEREWSALSQAEQLAVAPVLARLYLATRDDSVRQYDFCTHKPGALAEAIVNTFVEAMSMESAPAPYRLEKPGSGTEHMDILRSYLYCESEAEREVTDLPVGDAGPDLSKPRPDQDEALKLYQAWSGVCDMDDPEIRRQVETGAQLAWPEALQCVFSHQLAGRGWPDLSETERGDLLDEVIALSLLTKDPEILALELCDLSPDIRWEASQIVFEQFEQAYARPPDKRPPVPFGFAIPLHRRIEC